MREQARDSESVEKNICNYMHSSCARGPAISCVDSFPCHLVLTIHSLFDPKLRTLCLNKERERVGKWNNY